MAINLAHRPDLDSRVEQLADRLGLKGRGRKTATIKRALTPLEKHVAHDRPERRAGGAMGYRPAPPPSSPPLPAVMTIFFRWRGYRGLSWASRSSPSSHWTRSKPPQRGMRISVLHREKAIAGRADKQVSARVGAWTQEHRPREVR